MASTETERKTESEDNKSPVKDAAIAVGAVALGAVAIGGLGLLVGPYILPVCGVLKLAELAKDAVAAVANAEPLQPNQYHFDQRAADVEYARRRNPGGLVFAERMELVGRKHGY